MAVTLNHSYSFGQRPRPVVRFAQLFDPCISCRYRGLCDDGECGALGFAIDVNKSPIKK